MDIRWILLLTALNYHAVKGGGCGCFGGRSRNSNGASRPKQPTAQVSITEFNSKISNLSAQQAVKVNEGLLGSAIIIVYLNIVLDYPRDIELLQQALTDAQSNRSPSSTTGGAGNQVTKLSEQINKLKKQYEIALGNIVEILGKDLNNIDEHLSRAADTNALNELQGKLKTNKDELQQRCKDLKELDEQYKAVRGDQNLQSQIQNAESLNRLLHELRQIGKLFYVCEIIEEDLKVRTQWTTEYIIKTKDAAKQALQEKARGDNSEGNTQQTNNRSGIQTN